MCTRDTQDALQLEANCGDIYGPLSAYAYTSLSFMQLPTSSVAAPMVTPQILVGGWLLGNSPGRGWRSWRVCDL